MNMNNFLIAFCCLFLAHFAQFVHANNRKTICFGNCAQFTVTVVPSNGGPRFSATTEVVNRQQCVRIRSSQWNEMDKDVVIAFFKPGRAIELGTATVELLREVGANAAVITFPQGEEWHYYRDQNGNYCDRNQNQLTNCYDADGTLVYYIFTDAHGNQQLMYV
ncbi:hypothetical protein niasHT_017670 [Heterodera trifolii]|uniref:Uncharacterized protein n=1 Tax=Heterodera trifolii TaxID=157864 RepID=A0ABD2L872_9BILA